MKKLFTILGGIFAALIFVAVVGFFIINHFGSGLDEESKACIDSNLPQILTNWDIDELINRASPELLEVVPKEKIQELLKVFMARLGPLKEYKGSKGQSHMSVTTQNGKVITGVYIAEADFAKAPATINFRIIKHDNKWQILDFRVTSDALIP